MYRFFYEGGHHAGGACIVLLLLTMAGSFFGALGATMFTCAASLLPAYAAEVLTAPVSIALSVLCFPLLCVLLRYRSLLVRVFFFVRGFCVAYSLVLLRGSTSLALFLALHVLALFAAMALLCVRQ